MQVQRAQNKPFTPGYSLARCLKGYPYHILSSKQWFPKYQPAEEEYSNTMNRYIFPPDISKNAQTLHRLAVYESWKREAGLLPCSITCCCPERPVPPSGYQNQGRQQQRNTSKLQEEWRTRGQGLNENRSHDEAWLGVRGGKRRELVRNAACVREKIRDINLGKTPISS